MKPPSQVGNGENYPSFDSPDRGVASLILGVGKKQSRADSNVRFDPLGARGLRSGGFRKCRFDSRERLGCN
jgi:hypothetical protein